ncbi:MAG: HAD family phosphatase [Hyphomicrobiales bacterium]
MTLAAVAWDIDGTLVDSEPLHHRALVAVSAGYGVDLSDLPDQAFVGIHIGDVWTILRPRMPVSLDESEWVHAINRYYVEHRHELVITPGAVETVQALHRRGVKQACVSNSNRMIVDANLDAIGIARCLSFSLSLDDVVAGKPDPYPYAEACRRLAVAPAGVIAVEDSATGLASARAAGLRLAGFGPHVADDAVDVRLRRLDELLGVVF